MKKALLAVICVVIGIALGVLLMLFIIGSPKAKPLPGEAIKPPDPGGDPPGTAVVSLDEKFFDPLLASIFRDLGGPTFPLELAGGLPVDTVDRVIPAALQQNDCPDLVIIKNEGSNIKTGVRFADGKIVAPLAFTGSKNLFGACVRFEGWAQASIQVSFDREKQTVYGQIDVEGVNLEGAPAAIGGVATMLVQRSINQRINPLEILRAPQLALSMPVASTNGTLKAQVKDVRAEVANGKLTLHITYDFTGVRGQPPPQG